MGGEEGVLRARVAGLRLQPHGVAGALLIALFWPASWLHWGVLGTYAFFPLWVGYVLVVDYLVWLRTGTSLAVRSPWRLAGLFLLSAPFWWAFEFYNDRILPAPNWRYLYRPETLTLSGSEAWKTICFSTVIPAELETLELVASFVGVAAPEPGRPYVRPRNQLAQGLLGAAYLALAVWQGQWAFGLVWLGPALLLDLANYRLGRRSIVGTLAQGQRGLFLSLLIAGPLCGFFWEMWNWHALPKWIYVLPGLLGPHVFEMPLAGYLGYPAFAGEVYALASLVLGAPRESPASRF